MCLLILHPVLRSRDLLDSPCFRSPRDVPRDPDSRRSRAHRCGRGEGVGVSPSMIPRRFRVPHPLAAFLKTRTCHSLTFGVSTPISVATRTSLPTLKFITTREKRCGPPALRCIQVPSEVGCSDGTRLPAIVTGAGSDLDNITLSESVVQWCT